LALKSNVLIQFISKGRTIVYFLKVIVKKLVKSASWPQDEELNI